MATGLIRIVEVAQRIIDGRRQPGPRARDRRPGAAAQPRVRDGRRVTMAERAQSSASARRTTRRCATTSRSRACCARRRSARSTTRECTFADIDAVVIGKAPDAFEGIVQPELFLADALGAAGKPMLRVHTAGSVGGSTFIVGCAPHRVAHPRARARDRVGEAERGQRAVGPRRWPQPGHRRGRRVRAVDPRVHRARPARPSTSAGRSR